ncbi:MAG: hypothetical protein A2Z97_02885 [Bdellovibrionales bacterium GWB1_52_6]|nr:MAG: hypothetical protein A2Z97_02885 [Bdellovibrionales bacterium GWB1_52_6]OFZ03464.1 MAG: hypothetical protein A2X97_05820 [Bdellovibrionales bacterium GWA1_52_35]HCM41047.1 hypothetical protein [Bdellovibrionales bacterium]
MSSPWSALLESLHSALIDELTDHFADQKPSLGLPLNRGGFLPPESAKCLLIFNVRIEGVGGEGVAFLSASEDKMDLHGVWCGLMRRAVVEFSRRRISPDLKIIETTAVPMILRSVWIPIEIHGTWHLGIGR